MINLNLITSSGEKTALKIESFEINNQLKDSWLNFKNDSILSLPKMFCRFVVSNFQGQKQTYYAILRNALAIYQNQEINLSYKGEVKFYLQETIEKKVFEADLKELKKIKTEAKMLHALIDNNLSFQDVLHLNNLENILFDKEAEVNFSLVRKEVQWNSEENI
ncbi:MSC_0621 family F1-like ATPase epsilon subunit [Mycoplasmopsis gallopavonis]|uniref:Uncharacterized protein n=1 Tax=Mycoplasmopsis gallopavonis TaxID=76629 RepID=A0A449B0G7_9BACT|nr:hypothetical protein [Mycoplasmopsis gallopavonis]RIV16311.1 hypothetical protein D1113_02855 [Mycoplasmopsis gallopavonis]VEU73234.1 Uncharacterised protein [Mycoplasmopsis gallopavonis]